MGAIIVTLLEINSDPDPILLRIAQRCATHQSIAGGTVAPRVSALWPLREVNLVLLPGNLSHTRWDY